VCPFFLTAATLRRNVTHSTVTYDEVEPRAPGMHFLRDALDCEELGLTVVDVEESWTGKEHDHAHDDQEEVYLLLEGAGTLTVDGEDLSLDAGDAVRVAPDSTRQLHVEADSLLVVAGAP
jgi:mannose-6-phosphate isomerase-like protein (cupin superfamily)